MARSEGPDLSKVHVTALAAAAMRAAHMLRDAPPHIFDDPFALPLTGLTPQEAIAWAAPSVGLESQMLWPLRSRYAEDRLEAARSQVSQYVILGAGLDSFALRMAGRLDGLRVFEVDDPPMQAWKRQRLAQLGLRPPPELSFAPCNFEQTSLASALAAAGYDDRAPTFIAWLGVTQYISRAATEETLRWAAARAPGSEIVLSYVPSGPASEQLARQMAARGTVFGNFFTPDEMSATLQRAGFRAVDHLTEAQIRAAYFNDRTDGTKIPRMERMVSGLA